MAIVVVDRIELSNNNTGKINLPDGKTTNIIIEVRAEGWNNNIYNINVTRIELVYVRNNINEYLRVHKFNKLKYYY